MSGLGSGWNMPPGCYEWMIPGNRPEDIALDNLLDKVAHECPTCKQPTHGDGEYGMAPHITVSLDCCAAYVRCDYEASEDEPCETDLASVGGGCRECDPPEPWD